MADILQRILSVKADEVAEAKRRTPLAALEAAIGDASEPRDFVGALCRKIAAGGHRGDQESEPEPWSAAPRLRT